MNRNIKNKIILKKMEVSNQYKSERCDIRLGDCVQLIQSIPDESIGFSIFSPPFAELYTYSDKLEDMGNSKDYQEFFKAFKFLVKELYRVMWGGKISPYIAWICLFRKARRDISVSGISQA